MRSSFILSMNIIWSPHLMLPTTPSASPSKVSSGSKTFLGLVKCSLTIGEYSHWKVSFIPSSSLVPAGRERRRRGRRRHRGHAPQTLDNRRQLLQDIVDVLFGGGAPHAEP